MTLVWDIKSGKCLRALSEHSDRVSAIALTQDGRLALSGSKDKTLRIWDIENGRCLQVLLGHTGEVYPVVLRPDGRVVVSGDDCKYILRIWDIKSGQHLQTLEGHRNLISCLASTIDGRYMISGSHDYTLRVWDFESPECSALVPLSAKIHTQVAVKDNLLMIGDLGGNICFFEAKNLKPCPPLVTPVYLYRYDRKAWDRKLSTQCEWCGQRFIPPASVIEAIRGINQDANLSPAQSPCLQLPDEAWDEPRLLSECPHCHQPLKFNPFIVDNRDRY
ncbi:MAG: WD40 repeat domain-containing protein [bacterium]